MLDEDFAYARENACWALGYIRADSAREELEEFRHIDSNEEIRGVPEWALGQIEGGE